MDQNKKRLTTSSGAPVGDNQNSVTAGNRGPVLLQDVHLLEKLAHFDRERIRSVSFTQKVQELTAILK